MAALREQLQGQVGAGEARWSGSREREGYGAAPAARPTTTHHAASATFNGIADLQIDNGIQVC